MKYLALIRIFILWFIWLSVAYSAPTPIPEITILTSALGKDGEKFPSELTKLWQPILINVNSNSVEIAPNIKLFRIDLPEEKEFVIPSSNSLLDSFIKPDPRVSLKKAYNYLEQSKINGDFSNSQPINEIQLQANKEMHSKEISLSFEIVSTKSSALASNQFSSITELLPALKKQIEKDNVADVASLKYAIFYKLPEAKGNNPSAIAQESIVPIPNIKGPASAESTASCIIAPTTTAKKSNWYAVIEIGSTGVKPIAMGFKRTKQGELISAGIQEVETFNVQNVDPIVEISRTYALTEA